MRLPTPADVRAVRADAAAIVREILQQFPKDLTREEEDQS